MKKVNKPVLIVTLGLLVISASAISISSTATNLRCTFDAINPWNGVEAIAFVVSYFLRSGSVATYAIALGLYALFGGAIYLVITRVMAALRSICNK